MKIKRETWIMIALLLVVIVSCMFMGSNIYEGAETMIRTKIKTDMSMAVQDVMNVSKYVTENGIVKSYQNVLAAINDNGEITNPTDSIKADVSKLSAYVSSPEYDSLMKRIDKIKRHIVGLNNRLSAQPKTTNTQQKTK